MSIVGLTALIADFAANTPASNFSDAALDAAERAVVDTVGVMLAGSREPTVATLIAGLAGRLPEGPCTVHGGVGDLAISTQPIQAALINGTAAHALDYDDVSDGMRGHLSAVLTAALLALGEETKASGRDVLEAICVGQQVGDAIGTGLGIDAHYTHGWHSTSTVGVVPTAAAASRILGLDAYKTRLALGIAGSMAAGSRQNFGTMTKPLHVGFAASNGILAALLAASGFTSDEAQLESPLGYLHLYGVAGGSIERAKRVLEEDWVIATRGLNVKQYPSCYSASRTADAALSLADDVDAGEIAKVNITLEPGGLRPLIHHRPMTGLQAKFSAEYVALAALCDKEIRFTTFTDAAVQRANITALLPKVAVEESPVPPIGSPEWTQSYSVVQVTTVDGSHFEARRDLPLGHAKNPLGEDNIYTKFVDCVSYSGLAVDAAALHGQLRKLRVLDDLRDLSWTD